MGTVTTVGRSGPVLSSPLVSVLEDDVLGPPVVLLETVVEVSLLPGSVVLEPSVVLVVPGPVLAGSVSPAVGSTQVPASPSAAYSPKRCPDGHDASGKLHHPCGSHRPFGHASLDWQANAEV